MGARIHTFAFWRLWWSHILHIAKPEAIFGILLMICSYGFQYATNTASWHSTAATLQSVAYPFIWAVAVWCIVGALRAAKDGHAQEVANWQKACEQAALDADNNRQPPRKPSRTVPIFLASVVTIPLAIVCFLSYNHASTQSRGASQPITNLWPEFIPAHAAFKKRLGDPVGDATTISDLRFHKHDNAIVLWINNPTTTFYALQGQPEYYMRQFDAFLEEGDQYENVDRRRKRSQGILQCEGAKKPPIGGVLKAMEARPDLWKWIGCLTWVEWFGANWGTPRVAIQSFSGGVIIGPLPRGEKRRHELIVYVLFPSKTDDPKFQGDWAIYEAGKPKL